MSEKIAYKFIAALSELESARDVESMVALFADNCEVGNVVATENLRGTEGAREFWTNYRNTFGDVCSIFLNQIYSDDNIALEWTTEGKTKNGNKIKYEGVSILETEGEKITRFYAYFDPHKLALELDETQPKIKNEID